MECSTQRHQLSALESSRYAAPDTRTSSPCLPTTIMYQRSDTLRWPLSQNQEWTQNNVNNNEIKNGTKNHNRPSTRDSRISENLYMSPSILHSLKSLLSKFVFTNSKMPSIKPTKILEGTDALMSSHAQCHSHDIEPVSQLPTSSDGDQSRLKCHPILEYKFKLDNLSSNIKKLTDNLSNVSFEEESTSLSQKSTSLVRRKTTLIQKHTKGFRHCHGLNWWINSGSRGGSTTSRQVLCVLMMIIATALARTNQGQYSTGLFTELFNTLQFKK